MTGIGYRTIKRLMRLHTNRPITRKAIENMAQRIESLIEEGTTLAEDLLHEENSFRRAQGMRENKRLSERYVLMAFDRLVNREENRGV